MHASSETWWPSQERRSGGKGRMLPTGHLASTRSEAEQRTRTRVSTLLIGQNIKTQIHRMLHGNRAHTAVLCALLRGAYAYSTELGPGTSRVVQQESVDGVGLFQV